MNKNKYLFLYWIFLVLLPFIISYIIGINNILLGFATYLMLYSIFISPFLFFIPYKLDKIKNDKKKNKILYILFGLVIPFIIAYLTIFIFFQKTFFPLT